MDIRSFKFFYKQFFSFLFFWLYIPHILMFFFSSKKTIIEKDVIASLETNKQELIGGIFGAFLFLVHTDSYFRTILYFRTGIIFKTLIGWYRPGNKYFLIPHNVKIGAGLGYNHPFSTILNAKRIGCNFRCKNNTTIGNKNGISPIIGDNVFVGVGANIIGDIKIGNNVIVGAGAVVVKDIPDNAIVAGNPARIIRYIIKDEYDKNNN